MQALRIYAGPAAMQHIAHNGLQASAVGVVPGAAGGPKGLILGPLDRFIFGDWLAQANHDVHLIGASIGAWRMATACLNDCVAGFEQLERDYIAQDYALKPGERCPSADTVSSEFGRSLERFYAGKVQQVLTHPRYKLHIIASRGRHILQREHKLATPMGYLGAFLSNAVHRPALGAWLDRVVFSSQQAALPFDASDYRTSQVALTEANFKPALQASCSIPFVLRSVSGIPGAPHGAYWDGGITDYHLHLNYQTLNARAPLVLNPHFQKAVVPGWFDKTLPWRHKSTPFLSNMVLLAPNPDWVRTLPNAKLPDRKDFAHYGGNLQARIRAWSQAASQAQQLADEFAAWVDKPDVCRVASL